MVSQWLGVRLRRAVLPITAKMNKSSWRVDMERNRCFRVKMIQPEISIKLFITNGQRPLRWLSNKN